MSQRIIASATIAALAAICLSKTISPAHAQSDTNLHAAQTPRSGAGARTLEQVTVVARRKAERLQRVPLSITAISARQLDQHIVTTGTDLQKLVPSLSVGVSIFGDDQQYSLRGIRTGVVTYFNEVPVESGLSDLQLWDLSSVQAVAGPQGTLFGRNSTGGAVLFVPQPPARQIEGFIDARYGSYNLKQLTAVLNVPLADNLQVRIGSQTTDRDGIVKNLSGPALESQDRQALRISVKYEPTDWLTNDAVLAYANRRDRPFAQIAGSDTPIGPCPDSILSCVYGPIYGEDLALQAARGIRTVDIPLATTQDDKPYQFSDILTANLSFATLRYLAGWQGTTSHQFTSDLSIPLPVIVGENNAAQHQVTQEVQALGKSFNDRLDWVTGLYYSNLATTGGNYYLLFVPPGTPFNLLTTQQTGGPNYTISKAAYAQASYAITHALKLTAGIRYTSDNLSTDQFGYSPGLVCNLPDLPGVNLTKCSQHIAQTSAAATYNLTLEYQATRDLLLYVANRRGYNAGGFNANIDVPSLEIVKPEYIADYEGGAKDDFQLFGIPMRADGSIYLAKYKDIQRTTSLISDGLVVTGNFNAAKATIYGAQLSVLARPTQNLTLDATYGYLHTKYDSFANALIGNATGNKFAQAPSNTVTVSANYRYPLSEGDIEFNVSYYYVSSVSYSDVNIGTPGNNAPGYGLVDMRLSWNNIFNRGVDLAFYVKNATNKTYILNTTDRTIPFGFDSRLYGDPMTLGGELRYSFAGL